MATQNREQLTSPQMQARKKLGRTIIRAIEMESLTEEQGTSLNVHLDGMAGSGYGNTMTQRRQGTLRGIDKVILARRQDLRPGLAKRFTEYGLLAAAVGLDSETGPMTRLELEDLEIIKQLRSRNPNIAPSIIVDEVMIKDLEWLSRIELASAED